MATIEVTQEHIDMGIPGNCASCPVALAVSDWLTAQGYPEVLVEVERNTKVYTRQGSREILFKNTFEILTFISNFDKHLLVDESTKVYPSSFTVEILLNLSDRL